MVADTGLSFSKKLVQEPDQLVQKFENGYLVLCVLEAGNTYRDTYDPPCNIFDLDPRSLHKVRHWWPDTLH